MGGIAILLRKHLGDCTFADLMLPCAVVAVDLKSLREVILRTSSLVEASRVSQEVGMT